MTLECNYHQPAWNKGIEILLIGIKISQNFFWNLPYAVYQEII